MINVKLSYYRLGMVNSNAVNLEFHLIQSFCEIFARFLWFQTTAPHSTAKNLQTISQRHGVKHTTSSPHYPQSNGFIERQIQTIKNLPYKALDAGTRSFQDILAELRSSKIGTDLPSPAEILHGRSLITGEPVTVDHSSVKAALVSRQIKDSQQYNRSHRVKSQRALVLGERCWGTGTNNEWKDCFITGIDKRNRCYQVVFKDTGRSLRRTRSHLRPCGQDIPHISEIYRQQYGNLVLSGGEESGTNQNSVPSGPTHNLERDTAVDLISDHKERTVNFPVTLSQIRDAFH